MPRRIKTLLTDAAGILLIVAAVLFGWLPGPGGIPLFLAGLGLLAINHEWARRWLRKVRDGGAKLSDKLFPRHWVAYLVYDALTVFSVGLAILIFYSFNGNIWRSVAVVLLALALGIFVFNRQRIEKIQRWVNRMSAKQPPIKR